MQRFISLKEKTEFSKKSENIANEHNFADYFFQWNKQQWQQRVIKIIKILSVSC